MPECSTRKPAGPAAFGTIEHCVAPAAQAPTRDGQRGPRAAAWRRGDRRHVDQWASSRAAREPPIEGRRVALVLVAVEKRGTKSGRVRMAVIPDFKATTWSTFITRHVAPGSTIYTDGLKSFRGLSVAGFTQVPRAQPLREALRRGATSVVPLADRAIGNLQQWLVGTHHGVSRGQLQVYLDEFAFRHHRRRTPTAAFQTLLGLGTGRAPTPTIGFARLRTSRIKCADRNILRSAETTA